jgi:hypothetical protein
MPGYELALLEQGPVNPDRPPTADELVGMGKLALGMGKTGRADAINAIGSRMGIPAGGWAYGISRLFQDGDIRLKSKGFLALLAHPAAARHIAPNLARAAQMTDTNVMLTFVTAGREHSSALTATGTHMVDSWRQGGLDFLWDTKNQLGLPKSVTGTWTQVPPFISPETHTEVHPAYIPARDQTMVYAAQISSSFQRHFKPRLQKDLGDSAAIALAKASRVARLIWQAYSFLAPGGKAYDDKKTLRSQLGQKFGSLSALSYVEHKSRAGDPAAEVSLDLVLKDLELNHSEWVRIAKVRVCETLFLERLWTTTRELVVVNP